MKLLLVKKSVGELHTTINQITFLFPFLHNYIFIAISKETFKFIKTNYKCFVFGDLNYDLFQHDNVRVNGLLSTMVDNCFYSIINKTASITDTSATILDHVWTKMNSDDIKTGVLLHPISDHLPVLTCQIKSNKA